jgi:hypothetical protein
VARPGLPHVFGLTTRVGAKKHTSERRRTVEGEKLKNERPQRLSRILRLSPGEEGEGTNREEMLGVGLLVARTRDSTAGVCVEGMASVA